MKNQKEQRHICIICEKKRNEKYMIKIPYKLTNETTLQGLNRWVCRYTVKKEQSNCLASFIKSKRKYLKVRMQILEQFEQNYKADNV